MYVYKIRIPPLGTGRMLYPVGGTIGGAMGVTWSQQSMVNDGPYINQNNNLT